MAASQRAYAAQVQAAQVQAAQAAQVQAVQAAHAARLQALQQQQQAAAQQTAAPGAAGWVGLDLPQDQLIKHTAGVCGMGRVSSACSSASAVTASVLDNSSFIVHAQAFTSAR